MPRIESVYSTRKWIDWYKKKKRWTHQLCWNFHISDLYQRGRSVCTDHEGSSGALRCKVNNRWEAERRGCYIIFCPTITLEEQYFTFTYRDWWNEELALSWCIATARSFAPRKRKKIDKLLIPDEQNLVITSFCYQKKEKKRLRKKKSTEETKMWW